MKVKILNKAKSSNSDMIIKDEIFGIDPNENVILRVLNWQLAKKQQGDHKVKSRSEVKSTTAKMYRQKGVEELVMAPHQLFSFVAAELFMVQLLDLTHISSRKKSEY